MQISLAYLVLDMSMTALTAEVKVIAHSVADIFENAKKRAQRKLELEPGNSQNEKLLLKKFFWQYLQEELGNCVELHVEFLHIKNKIRPMLNATFVIVFYSTALTLASGAIYLSQLKFMTIFSLVILCYCVGVALECFCITRMVNTMSESNASIAQKIYNLEWPKNLEYDETYNAEYHSVRKTMTTVMVMAQQPLRLNCFGLFEFTQDKFYELLNMAYSLYTFLKNFV